MRPAAVKPCHVKVAAGQVAPVKVIVALCPTQIVLGVIVKLEMGFGLTITAIFKGLPLQPLIVGMIWYT